MFSWRLSCHSNSKPLPKAIHPLERGFFYGEEKHWCVEGFDSPSGKWEGHQLLWIVFSLPVGDSHVKNLAFKCFAHGEQRYFLGQKRSSCKGYLAKGARAMGCWWLTMTQEFGRPHWIVSARAEKRCDGDGTEALISLKDKGRHLSIFHVQIILFLALIKLPTPKGVQRAREEIQNNHPCLKAEWHMGSEWSRQALKVKDSIPQPIFWSQGKMTQKFWKSGLF